MGQTQSCSVCGATGILSEGRIFLNPGGDQSVRFIGECPRCQRFICDRHCEPLDLSGKPAGLWFSFGKQKPRVLVACCPFDPGTPLGDRL